MTKNERQEIARERWRNAKGKGCFIHPTGFGKTYETSVLIDKVLTKTSGIGKVLILVPFVNLIKQWQESIDKLVVNKDNVQIMTVQLYVMNNYHESPLLLVLDELDEFYGEERIKIVKGITCAYKFVVGLTATPHDKTGRQLIAFQYIPIVDEITEQEALDNKWISDYKQYNLKIELNENERKEYDTLTEIIGSCFGKFHSFEHAMSVLTGNKETGEAGYQIAIKHAMFNGWKNNMDLSITANQEINNVWNPNKIIGYAKTFNEAVRIRNTLLDLGQEKFDTTLRLISKFLNTKTIIFSNSIAFANKIHLLINQKHQIKDNLFDNNYPYCVLYHSDMESQYVFVPEKNKKVKYGVKKLKEYYLNLVRQGFSKAIASAKALDKGLDIKDIRLAIIAGGNSTTNRQKQREGRAKRLETLPHDKPVIIINLYYADTKEERDLKDRQKRSLKSKIQYIDDIDDVNLDEEEQEITI